MPRYSSDPHWTTARMTDRCRKCDQLVRKGDRMFYYPATRTVLCSADACGGQASRDFEAARFDEGF